MTMNSVRRRLRRLHEDSRGAMSVEKILILGLIALPILIILFLFRKTIINWFQGQAGQLSDPGNAGAGGSNGP
jgi:Flp pilus assembly pilin Flp